MRKRILGVVGAMAMIAATAAPGLAAVNCGLIKKDLDMGRKPEDIAERMAVSVDEVNKCKQGAATTGTPGTAPGAAGSQPTSAPAGQMPAKGTKAQ